MNHQTLDGCKVPLAVAVTVAVLSSGTSETSFKKVLKDQFSILESLDSHRVVACEVRVDGVGSGVGHGQYQHVPHLRH